ncbi:phenylalanyl-tRNA synthetase, alpha subunit [Caldanaerobius fijiensis DSM 17918]|uniref:Phenylalanine--tRNA ligase alpha subunit n=1 Tax=Caldanaerobius fijiensis DSM 17918 TaxID=1121256 RepID=A0A1M4XH74_9THEO|nr:phenylalanyl-tRNA synthetase, alpha subunit [Caldanaerobius fijiensis DSM 17918]
MREKLESMKSQVTEEIAKAVHLDDLEKIRIKYMGKKGLLTEVLKGMGKLPPEERPVMGQIANQLRDYIEEILTKAREDISKREKEARLQREKIDVTMPGKIRTIGKRHPLTSTLDQIKDIFLGMGFDIVDSPEDGPEVELDYYNFEALNIPKNHPSRDIQDSFYINEDIVLRSQTSPVQIRTMEKHKPPIRVIVPGRVYRSDEVDATHSPIFHQIEGLVVDKHVTMGDLKGVLGVFAREFFGPNTKTKFRPSYFPFTEPSAEVDVTCFVCGGKGCRVCGNTGWIEILGAGMVHPKVLAMAGVDPEVYSGFAFGMGLDRIAMLKYGIDDMRLLFENDMRFIEQF